MHNCHSIQSWWTGASRRQKTRECLIYLLTRFEHDARTMSLVSSFMDMTGVAADRIIGEALKNQDLPQEAKDALQGVADLEQSRGHAVLHLLTLASTLDANLKLLR